MLKTIYTENELRNKLSNYANERIKSIVCDSVQIQITFKDGYATSFLSSTAYDSEIHFNSIASMKEACKKAYLDEGQENLEKVKAKEEQKRQEQQKEEKKEANNMNKDIVKKYVDIESKEGRVKMYYKDLQEKTNSIVNMVCDWNELGYWSEFSNNPYMQEGTKMAVTDVYFFAEMIIEQDKGEALNTLRILKDLFVNYLAETPINLTYFWNAFDRISENLEQPKEDKQEDKAPLSPSLGVGEREQPTLENDSKEITSLRLDLTDSERSAIHYLFELEKDRRNGIEWTAKDKAQAQKALDILTYLGILDKFPNLKDFEPDLEDFDQFKFYKSESVYEGGYLPTAQAIDFLDLTYKEIVEHDKVMALLQIPLNVLNLTEYIEVLPHNILRIHLKQGYQYQGYSFMDATVGQYQAFNLEDKDQIEQIQMFDLEDELEHFEEYKEQEIKQLQEALFDVDKDLDLMESIEEQTFINNYCYKKASFEDARRLAVRSAELATGTTKNALLDKRIDISSKISVLESSLQEFKAFSSQPIKYQ